MTVADMTPLIQLLETVILENHALRATLRDLPTWDDSTVDAHKEKWRPIVAQRFAPVYKHADNPLLLHKLLSGMLQSKKPN